jgi:hypothetical protein
VPIVRPFEPFDDDQVAEVQNKRSTLKEIVDAATEPASLRWAKLPEVIQSGLLGAFLTNSEEFEFHNLIRRSALGRASGA